MKTKYYLVALVALVIALLIANRPKTKPAPQYLPENVAKLVLKEQVLECLWITLTFVIHVGR